MKRLFAALLALVVAGAFTARAQSDVIIKQRAKDLRNNNDAAVRGQGGSTPPAATPPPATPPPAPAPPPPPPSQVDAELKQNLDKLQADLVTIKSGTAVPDGIKKVLEADFATLAKGSVRPSTTNLNKLADDLTTALSAVSAPREQGQLAQAINVVVNSSMVTAAQAQSFVVVAQTSLKSSGVPEEGIQTITTDLKNILAEVQKKKPKLYQ